MILIYSKDVDDFVNQVIDCLEDDFIRIGETDKVMIEEMNFSNENSSYIIKNQYFKSANLENIKSVWFNGGCISSGENDYENKCYEILNDAYILQQNIYKIGKRIADFETNRLDIMLEAKRQGLKIPHTLITGEKLKLINFYKIYNIKNGIVSKRILDSYFYEDGEYMYNFNLTFTITPEVLQLIPDSFTISLFQERIIAEFEIRVIYIDGDFYSVCIHDFDSTIDYRTKLIKMDNLRIVPFNLPSTIKEKLENIFKKFNLSYGSADLMYCNDEYYFLEINPAGQISFINNMCNFYIENVLSKKLTNGK